MLVVSKTLFFLHAIHDMLQFLACIWSNFTIIGSISAIEKYVTYFIYNRWI